VRVLGVDGCRAGWVGVLLDGREASSYVAGSVAALVELVGHPLDGVGIDIPIGLPDAGRRAAEGEVRRLLPGRGSTVFSTCVRSAYEAATYADALVVQRAATGVGLSRQSWGLRAKILEVDAWLRSDPGVAVSEVHPELAFAVMAGAAGAGGPVPVAEPKKSREGARARRRLLHGVAIEVPPRPGTGVGEDDLLDACAVAWSAARVARGEALCCPSVPERFSDGLPAAVHA
jgi:predicted RNase H-like nuclease